MILKSNNEDLLKRGYIFEEYLDKYNKYNKDKLLILLDSDIAYERSIAIRLLNTYFDYDDINFTKILLNKLENEKALYTKLEISKILEKQNIKTAKLMINYIGIIGKNQHKKLPSTVSKKKGYPIPRDIIVRILSHMDIVVLPILVNVLNTDDKVKISEIIDGIGFMIFHSNKNNNKYFFQIKEVMVKYKDNPVILWKCITCLSSFNIPESKYLLNQYYDNINNEILKEEINRSLTFID